MALALHRQSRLDRISGRIEHLSEQATRLLERESALSSSLEELRRPASAPGRVRRGHATRAIARTERRLERLRSSRAKLAEAEIRTIMLTLQVQSHQTRERLDAMLDRLAPIEAEWERLRETFESLEVAMAKPALEKLAGQWRGGLQIPEFPLQEREGYAKPFPHSAVVF